MEQNEKVKGSPPPVLAGKSRGASVLQIISLQLLGANEILSQISLLSLVYLLGTLTLCSAPLLFDKEKQYGAGKVIQCMYMHYVPGNYSKGGGAGTHLLVNLYVCYPLTSMGACACKGSILGIEVTYGYCLRHWEVWGWPCAGMYRFAF